MGKMNLGIVETAFADLIWENEPLTSGELVAICAKELNWKKSTTYTVLRRLCERGIFQNSNGTITSLLSKNNLQGMQSESFIEEVFNGSLPAFLSAFIKRRNLSEQEIEEIRQLIDSYMYKEHK